MQALFEKIQPDGQSFLVKERREKRFDFCWHYHPELELTWIAEGRGTRFVGDDISHYGAGDLVLLGPNLPHTWQAPLEARAMQRAVYAQFNAEFLGPQFLAAPEMSAVRRLFERAGSGLHFGPKTASEGGARLEKLLAAAGVQRLAQLLELWDLLARARDAAPLSSEAFDAQLRRGDQHRIDAVCRFINERIEYGVSQPEAAKVAHLSVPAFSRFFRRSLGRTFTAYVNELRVGRACQLLIETDKTIAEICYTVGFENLSNFNRRFLALKDLSPRAFRARYEQGQLTNE
jgi:AraC-like DNA-binding protein